VFFFLEEASVHLKPKRNHLTLEEMRDSQLIGM